MATALSEANETKIITVGFCPAWDITCTGSNLKWRSHQVIDSCTTVPAGKSLNISKALAWMKKNSVVAGLWGKPDFYSMRQYLAPSLNLLDLKLTLSPVATRRNVTVVDLTESREMHLRSPSPLATKTSLSKLSANLSKLVRSGDICVFAGSFPPSPLQDQAVAIVQKCARQDARIAIDTSGPALEKTVDHCKPWLVKPNLDELSELVGKKVANRESAIINAATALLDKTENILVSRGKDGVILVTYKGVWTAKADISDATVLSTVGCGDYLLGGFLNSWKDNRDLELPLRDGIVAATAKAFDMTNSSWAACKRRIKVDIKCVELFV